ncbi:DUF6086 family protein [Streptomyces flavofungini]|uniref:DUF6086 family protein n=1 Tax=Streptomyces flavofungini TaxID=68200 RepID=UPI0025B1AF93|nr:DUF6086 family protein [Streptomyces flavofungini]WJV51458.1 DUF6086 family protein [Streptomyces flavofungini]
MYFDVGEETLWNPSNGAGRLFLRQTQVFEAELRLPSGIGPGKDRGDPDTLEIDASLYAEFVRGLVAWHSRTGHSVILALSEGFVATAVALARRARIEVETLAPGDGLVPDGRDVQVPGAAQAASPSAVDTLDARAREMDRWMAR